MVSPILYGRSAPPVALLHLPTWVEKHFSLWILPSGLWQTPPPVNGSSASWRFFKHFFLRCFGVQNCCLGRWALMRLTCFNHINYGDPASCIFKVFSCLTTGEPRFPRVTLPFLVVWSHLHGSLALQTCFIPPQPVFTINSPLPATPRPARLVPSSWFLSAPVVPLTPNPCPLYLWIKASFEPSLGFTVTLFWVSKTVSPLRHGMAEVRTRWEYPVSTILLWVCQIRQKLQQCSEMLEDPMLSTDPCYTRRVLPLLLH